MIKRKKTNRRKKTQSPSPVTVKRVRILLTPKIYMELWKLKLITGRTISSIMEEAAKDILVKIKNHENSTKDNIKLKREVTSLRHKLYRAKYDSYSDTYIDASKDE